MAKGEAVMFDYWVEKRYGWTPFPERRLRVKIFGLVLTLWRWDV
jgi:hypothetical protein